MLAALAAFLVAWPTASSAQTHPDPGLENAQALFAAGTELNFAMTETSSRGETMPRIADSSNLVGAAFDLSRLQLLAGMSSGVIRPACEPAGNAKLKYMTLGTNEFEATSSDPAVQAQAISTIAKNFGIYQDEIVLATRFSLTCAALMMPDFEDLMIELGPDNPDARSGSFGIRRGNANNFDTAIVMASGQFTSSQNAENLINDILLHAPVYARTLDKEQRNVIISRIDHFNSPSLPENRRLQYEAIRRVLETSTCGPICSMQP